MRLLKYASVAVSGAGAIATALGQYAHDDVTRLGGALSVAASASIGHLAEFLEKPSKRRRVGAALIEFFRDQVLVIPDARKSEIPEGSSPRSSRRS